MGDTAGDRAREPPLEISDPYSAEQVLEGSRGKGDIADVGANKAPLGARARDASLVDKAGDRASEPPLEISDPYSAAHVLEGYLGKGDVADVGANKAPLGVRARDAVSEPSLEIGNPSSAVRVLEASCASGVFGVSSSPTPVSTTDHAFGSPMTDLPVDTLDDADNHEVPEASLRECSVSAVSEAERRDSPPEGFCSGGLRIGTKVKHALEASSSKSSNVGAPASSAVMSEAGQVVKPPGVTSKNAPHVVLTEAPFKAKDPQCRILRVLTLMCCPQAGRHRPSHLQLEGLEEVVTGSLAAAECLKRMPRLCLICCMTEKGAPWVTLWFASGPTSPAGLAPAARSPSLKRSSCGAAAPATLICAPNAF